MSITAFILTYADKPIVHPEDVRRLQLEYDWPGESWKLANSWECPRGQSPGRGCFLMLRRDIEEIDYTWKPIRCTVNGQTTTFKNYVIVKSVAQVRTRAEDPLACHLVEVADPRFAFSMSACEKQYNVRIPAPINDSTAADAFYTQSLNAGSVWTWQTMLSDLWAVLPSIAGTAPTLPYTPSGTPENWRFIGVNAWDGIGAILDRLECTIVYNPLTGAFRYARLDGEQAGLVGAKRALGNVKVWESDAISTTADVPETVRVFFRNTEKYYGTGKTTRRASNWEMDGAYSVDVASGIDGAIAGTVAAVWDDLPCLLTPTGSVANSSDLSTRATELAANYVERIYSAQGIDEIWYEGCRTTILPGEYVSRVSWHALGDAFGLHTRTISEPTAEKSGGIAPVAENRSPPDFARATHPVYPPVMQCVQAYDSGYGSGVALTASSGLFPGRVRRWANLSNGLDTEEECWLLFVDDYDSVSGAVEGVTNYSLWLGRLAGCDSVGGDLRPTYLVSMRRRGAWAGYLSSDVTVSSATTDVTFTQRLNTNTSLFGTPAGGYSFRLAKIGYYLCHVNLQSFGYDPYVWPLEAWLENSSAAVVPKSGIKTFTGAVSVGSLTDEHQHASRSVLIANAAANTDYKLRALKYLSSASPPYGDFKLKGATDTDDLGCSIDIHYVH